MALKTAFRILNGKSEMSRDTASYSTLIHRALDFAAQAHEGQYRKNRSERIPYISHPAMVARLLERAGFDEEVVAAGALHDVLEDTAVTRDELIAAFGKRVTAIVDFVTEQDKSLPWEVRKARYQEQLEEAPLEALALSCADKIHNLWSFVLYQRAGHDVWAIVKKDRDTQLARLEKLRALFQARFDHPLRDRFDEVLQLLKDEC